MDAVSEAFADLEDLVAESAGCEEEDDLSEVCEALSYFYEDCYEGFYVVEDYFATSANS